MGGIFTFHKYFIITGQALLKTMWDEDEGILSNARENLMHE